MCDRFFKNGEHMLNRFISLLLAVSILVLCAASLSACVPDAGGDTPPLSGGGGGSGGSIIKPEFKDYGRKTVKFGEIEYVRPDAEKLISDFSSVTDAVKKNEIPYEDQLGAIISLEDGYNTFSTMYSYSNIRMSEDARDTYWCEEHEYISGYAPSFTATIEKLYVAAAQSVHAESFERDYFGIGLIEEYKDGGIYTKQVVALLEEETAIENRYSSLSTANVVITYKGMTKSYDDMIAFFADTYGNTSLTYEAALKDCAELYEKKLNEITRGLLIDVLKVRKKIAKELGYSSYAEYAYGEIYHDYTSAAMISFIKDVATYVIPVYSTVSYYVLWPYFDQVESGISSVDKVDLINTLYYAYEGMDAELADIYLYMLQYELYDIAPANDNRFEGSFCTYLDNYEAPYVFLSTTGGCDDYMTLAHEFGHFVDGYINHGAGTSIDLAEVSSQALEYLTLNEIKDELSEEEYKYLLYSQISSAFDVLLFQSFYALFEHYAYNIGYDGINEQGLTVAMQNAARDMGMSTEYFDSLDYVLIPHIILYPFYVQSYAVSAAVALEIYYTEDATEGAGLEAYMDLIDRSEGFDTLEENLKDAGLTSPFSKNYLKMLADMIHYDIMGSHYYKENAENNNAA